MRRHAAALANCLLQLCSRCRHCCSATRFFVNTVSGQTAWHLPGTTPSHSSSSEEGQLQWESVWTDGGEQYYYNKLTGETRCVGRGAMPFLLLQS